jgi:hypothetical protein
MYPSILSIQYKSVHAPKRGAPSAAEYLVTYWPSTDGKQKEHVDCPVPLGICRWLSSCSPIMHHHCSISSLVVWSHTDTEEIHWKSPKAVMNPTCDQSRTVRIIGASFVIDFMQLLEHFCMERHSEGSEALRFLMVSPPWVFASCATTSGCSSTYTKSG